VQAMIIKSSDFIKICVALSAILDSENINQVHRITQDIIDILDKVEIGK
jgi:hypothetical protein